MAAGVEGGSQPCDQSQEAESKQQGRAGYEASRPASSDPQPSRVVPVWEPSTQIQESLRDASYSNHRDVQKKKMEMLLLGNYYVWQTQCPGQIVIVHLEEFAVALEEGTSVEEFSRSDSPGRHVCEKLSG